MKISLIDYTGMGHPDPEHAINVLIFTKNTRLNMSAMNFQDIADWPRSKKMEELAYMANTIPSSWEFVNYTFMVEGVTRACTHQMVRTRTASFAQQSMRVTDMSGFDYRFPKDLPGASENMYKAMMGDINDVYSAMLKEGAPEEDARGILPTNILTNIVCHYNLRTMSDLVKSRSGGRTQDEYREVIALMADRILEVHPWAELFLFPKGRNYFTDLETSVAKVKNRELRTELLKIIDKMRKE